MMTSRTFSKGAMAVAVLALLGLGAGQAQASTINLALSGVVANATSGSDFWSLDLTIDSYSSLTIAPGDTVNATITLDGPATIQASDLGTFFSFELRPASCCDFSNDTQTFNGAATFYYQGSLLTPPGTVSGAPGTSGVIATGGGLGTFLGPMTFDTVISSFDVDQILYGPMDITDGHMSFTLINNPVPDAGSSLVLLGVGLAGLGAARRRLKA